MPKRGKKYKAALELFDKHELYETEQAMEIVIKTAGAKFDETIEAHYRRVLTEDMRISRSEAQSFFLTEQAKPRESWYLQRDRRQLKLKKPVLIM